MGKQPVLLFFPAAFGLILGACSTPVILSRGVAIEEIVPGGPASKAELQKGDVIHEINQRDIDSIQDYEKVVASLKPEDKALLRITRSGLSGSILVVVAGSWYSTSSVVVKPVDPALGSEKQGEESKISAVRPLSIGPGASDVDRLPDVKVSPKKNVYAVVVGIEQYREKLPKADFADRDATLMGEYLTKVLGYPEENVVVRTNEKASLTDLIKYLESWLPNNAEKDSSVFVYYSGHGAPNTKTGEAYLVPYDGDPTFVDKTGYSLKRLYEHMDKLPAKEVVVMLDSCFSGQGGRSVIAKGQRPMGISIETPVLAGGKTIVLAASSGDQTSSTYDEKGHGLLTYFFLKGLQGDGDTNRDGAIEMVELFEYLKPNVQRVARKQYNNEQTPQLLASPEILRKGSGRLVERAP